MLSSSHQARDVTNSAAEATVESVGGYEGTRSGRGAISGDRSWLISDMSSKTKIEDKRSYPVAPRAEI